MADRMVFRMRYEATADERDSISVDTTPLNRRQLKRLIRVLQIMHDVMPEDERDKAVELNDPGTATDG